MAPNIFLLLRFFFILSFYISLSPNHYFVTSDDSSRSLTINTAHANISA